MGNIPMRRVFAMPHGDTFSVKPIGDLVKRYASKARRIVDPFARNSRIAHLRNDLNPATDADHHMDASAFCDWLAENGESCDMGLFDPPYSPRQISEVYKGIGRAVTVTDTQNAALYRRVRDSLDKLIIPGGVVLSFGWHSNGMGSTRGYDLAEILLVAHGGAHNDTICIAEVKRQEARDA